MSDITSSDLDYIESVFEQIDINNDGTISLSELASSKKNKKKCHISIACF